MQLKLRVLSCVSRRSNDRFCWMMLILPWTRFSLNCIVCMNFSGQCSSHEVRVTEQWVSLGINNPKIVQHCFTYNILVKASNCITRHVGFEYHQLENLDTWSENSDRNCVWEYIAGRTQFKLCLHLLARVRVCLWMKIAD